MKTISLKMNDTILAEIDKQLTKHRFSTRTEFIREAIRDKLHALEKQGFDKEIRAYLQEHRQALHSEVHEAAHDVFHELEKRFGHIVQDA